MKKVINYIIVFVLVISAFVSGLTIAKAEGEVEIQEQPTEQVKEYTITLDANGGSLEVTTLKIKTGEKYTNLPIPTRDKYKFVGWFTKKDGSFNARYYANMYKELKTTVGQDNDKLKEHWYAYGRDEGKICSQYNVNNGIEFKETNDITLYAIWEHANFTVTFDAMGGTVTPSSISINTGEKYANLPVPTKKGYQFSGWYKNSTDMFNATWYANNNSDVKEKVGTDPDKLKEHWLTTGLKDGKRSNYSSVNNGVVFDDNKNITLYSGWEPLNNQYKITFDANGGKVSAKEMYINTGDKFKDLPTPTKEGYIFYGWYSDKSDFFDERYYKTTYKLDSSITSDYNKLREHWLTVGMKEGKKGSYSSVTNGVEFEENDDITLYAQWVKIKIEGKLKYEKNEMYYYDSYFYHTSEEYDSHLASLSMLMTKFSMNADGPDSENDTNWYKNQSKRIKGFFDTIGFEDFEANEDYKKRTAFNTIGVAIASRQIDDYTIIGIVPRSGGYFLEWGNNMWLGDGSKSDYMHEGWYNAANKLIDFLDSYLKMKNITGDIKVWISGYSRGGATANLAAGILDNKIGNSAYKFSNGARLTRNNLYAYTFEAPMGANINSKKVKAPKDKIYNNIFNIINPNDLVPKVAMHEWGFTRFGIDKFTTTEFFDPNNYSNYKTTYNALYKKNGITDAYKADKLDMYGISGEHYFAATMPIGIAIETIMSVYKGELNFVEPDTRKKNYDGNVLATIVLEEVVKSVGSRKDYVKEYQTALREILLIVMNDASKDRTNRIAKLVETLIMGAILKVSGVDSITSGFSEIFSKIFGKTISKETYTPLLSLLVSVYTERPNEIVTFLKYASDIFQNHDTDVSVTHVEAHDSYYIDNYNKTSSTKIKTQKLRDNADMARLEFLNFNTVSVTKNGVENVKIQGKLAGKSDVNTCKKGYACGYYSYIEDEKMEVFLPSSNNVTQYTIKFKDYSKKPIHTCHLTVSTVYSSISSSNEYKKKIYTFDSLEGFNSDEYTKNLAL